MSAGKSVNVSLSAHDIEILVQSLSNCIETCKEHQGNPNAPCKDCDAARSLRTRLQKSAAA